MIAIIGGTSGIGYATAKYLNKKKYKILICGRRKNKNYQYLDVTDENSIKECFKKIDSLDGLIYSAGITTSKSKINKFNINTYKKIMDVNVTGLLLCLKYSYHLLKNTQGKIVVVNSLASRTYSQFSGVEYSISKMALSGLVKHLSVDFAKDKVFINSVFPSMTATPMLMSNINQEQLEDIENKIPLNRIAKPLEIAKAIEFLIGKNNTYMTGCGLDINGGQFLNG